MYIYDYYIFMLAASHVIYMHAYSYNKCCASVRLLVFTLSDILAITQSVDVR